jgi:hypothetical protein
MLLILNLTSSIYFMNTCCNYVYLHLVLPVVHRIPFFVRNGVAIQLYN